MKCKTCEDLKTSLMCKNCVQEYHDHNHPPDPQGEGKYFNGLPMCFCVSGDITITSETSVPEITIGGEYDKE